MATKQITRYTDIEKAIAKQIIKKLQKIIDLYLGTDITKGELLVRNLAIYERNTFRLLLLYHAYIILYTIEKDLSSWGRNCFTENEIYHIIAQVSVYINGWVKQYIIFTKKHPDILVSDIAAKRSKVLIYIDLSKKGWEELQELVGAVYKELLGIYKSYCLYTSEDISTYREKYPTVNFIAAADIQDALSSGIKNVMDISDYSTDLFNAVIVHTVARLSNNTNQLLKYKDLDNDQAGIVDKKHQEFIDYLTQQVFSDEGYLYSGARENIQTAITNNSVPSARDFTNFLLARADTNAFEGLYSTTAGNHVYNESDMAAVISRNRATVQEHGVMSYLTMLDEAGLLKPDDKEVQVAFGYRIPNEDIIQEISAKIMAKAKEIAGDVLTSAAISRNTTPSDISGWRLQLQDTADTAAEAVASDIVVSTTERQNGSTGNGIDASFTDPMVDAGLGALVSAVNQGKNSTASSADATADEILKEIPNLDRGYSGINVNTKNPVKVSEFPAGITSYTVIDPDTGKIKKIPVTKSVVTTDGVKEVPVTSTTTDTETTVTPPTANSSGGSVSPTGTGSTQPTSGTGSNSTGTGSVVPTSPTENKGITPNAGALPPETPTQSVTLVKSRDNSHKVIRMPSVASEYVPTYRTFSGHDMIVTISIQVSPSRTINKVIGAFQTITYSIHNEKAPVRVLGNMNVKRYVFGPRTIAGSLILIVFDKHWMKEFLGTYAKIKNKGVEQYFLMDELPAFDLTISCCNEYGHSARMALYGVTIVNEGQVMSINDIYTENTYQFFATNVDYLDSVANVIISTKRDMATDNIPTRTTTTGTAGVATGESENGAVTGTAATTGSSTEETPIVKVLNTSDIIKIAYDSKNPRLGKYEAIVQSAKEGYLYKANDKGEVVLDLKEGQRQIYAPSKAAADFNSLQDIQTEDIFMQWKNAVYNLAVARLCERYNTTEASLESMLAGTDNGALKTQLGDRYNECYDIYKYYKQTLDSIQQQIEQAENTLADTYRAKVNVPPTDKAVSDTSATVDNGEEGEQPEPSS